MLSLIFTVHLNLQGPLYTHSALLSHVLVPTLHLYVPGPVYTHSALLSHVWVPDTQKSAKRQPMVVLPIYPSSQIPQ